MELIAKRIIISLLLVSLLFVMLYYNCTVAENSGKCGENLIWTLDDSGILRISGTGKMFDYQFIYGNDNEITSAPWGAEPTCIVFDSSVTNIGSYAFYHCNKLKNILIPGNILTIGDFAFDGCSNLDNVSILDGVTSLGNYAFANCYNLLSVSISESVNYIGDYAFWECSKLQKINLPNKICKIGNHTFSFCSNLSSIVIPLNVSIIGDYAFYECGNLRSISIPDTVTSIGYSAFAACNISSFQLPSKLNSISDWMFAGCANLRSITIPESVKRIGSYAFDGCSSLSNITIPNNVTYISERAFSGCHSLQNIVIPNSVINIGRSAFSDCVSLKTVKLSENINIIEDDTFSHCTTLSGITIPNSVNRIGKNVFYDCNNLKRITIPESVINIDDGAFSHCKNLKEIYFTINNASPVLFSDYIFDDYSPIIYCHRSTAPEEWCIRNSITPVYLESVENDTIRSITLPDDFRLTCGDTQDLSYCVFPADNDRVTWVSSNPSAVSVNNGIVTAHLPGKSVITATIGTISESITIETYIPAIGFELSDEEMWVLTEDTAYINVVSYMPANASANIKWSSSGLWTYVNDDGIITTGMPGDVIITATTEKGISRECLLHVCFPVTYILLSIDSDSMRIGQDYHLTANVTMRDQNCINHLITFSSNDENVVTIDQDGTVHAVGAGEAVLTASAKNGKSASITVQVVSTCQHIPEDIPSVKPTKDQPGRTAGKKCSICGEILSGCEEIPALGYEPGDLNGNGTIDGRDLLRLARYLAGGNVEINEAAADLNGDGKVDGRDLLRLARYLAGQDVKLGK